ncbi:hypothetical protein ACHAXT_000120 [Thalassiosira profunda]
MSDPAASLEAAAPNSKPRDVYPARRPSYVYQDMANAEPSRLYGETCHQTVPPKKAQCQKLPSKLDAMLCDPALAPAITWMPHGRSWKILDRELFASLALPRYFGHDNHTSFVRLVNAWGFRRITKGTDHDSYYHELFLRGKPRLHERMKRMPACHLKTPLDNKDAQGPDFYALAKTSPLPEVEWNYSGKSDALAPKGKRLAATTKVSAGYTAGNANAALLDNFGSSALGNAMGSFQPASDGSLMHKFMPMPTLPYEASASLGQLGQTASFNHQPTSYLGVPLNQAVADFPQQINPSNGKISVTDMLWLEAIQHTNQFLEQKLSPMKRDTLALKQRVDGVPPSSGNVPPSASNVPTSAGNVPPTADNVPSSAGNVPPNDGQFERLADV